MLSALGLLLLGPSAASAADVAVGAYVDGGASHPRAIDKFADQTGRNPVVVGSYRDWTKSPFNTTELWTVWNRGSVPLVTWEPWQFDNPGQSYPLRAIANGSFDGYIRQAARDAAAWQYTILVRFAHEMNGRWYPWGRDVGGNTAPEYRDAWRHVVDIFRQEGARNVKWVWTPFVDTGRLPFARFYPGDRWVNWVGLDGFNWGGPTWFSFAKIFGASYKKVTQITRRPMIIAETGSVEQGGDKPEWIRRALGRALPRFDRVRALVWWDAVHPSGSDWRIDTSASSLGALREGLAAPRYGADRAALLATPARLP